jgi:ATP-dependent RNA/DNA helicase IGHMBP2
MDPEIEELIRVQELLQKEKEEDYRQYNEQVIKASLSHRKSSGLTWYPVVISNSEVGLGEYIILELERTAGLDEPHQFGAGKMASLFSNRDEAEKGESLNGVVKYVQGNKMKLHLTVDELPDWVEEGRLGLDLLFDEASYREMEIALHKVINAEKGPLARLRAVLYGARPARFDQPDEPAEIGKLNPSQNEALNKVASALDVAIIHGPPGTGKTTTLVEAVKYTLRSEKQVLVCSPSNVAVDLLTEKLSEAGLNVLRLGNPARISDEVLNNTLDVRITGHKYYKDLKDFIRRADEFRNMARKYKRNFGRAEREQRQLLFAESKSILKEARKLEDHILDELLEKAQVIACTPVNSAGRYLRDRFFETVFIDEAGQALEPMCWIPITRAGRVIMAGDHFQLPPTVKSKEAEGLKTTLFEKCILRQEGADVMLDIQYRMNSKIMGFSGEQFYKGKLRAHESVASHVLDPDPEEPLLNAPVDFIDTAGCGFSEVLNPETQSIANPEEAEILLKYLETLLDRFSAIHPRERPSIGIIAPYSSQVQCLTGYLGEMGLREKYGFPIAVKTVDGFQGQEKDIICISLVRSNEEGDIGFLSDTRRMNVALTRARKKLVVVGDSATLSRHPFYRDFFDYTEKISAYKSAWEIMG